VYDRQHTIHSVHNKQYKPAEIFSLKNQTPDQEQDYKSYTDRTHITGKAFRSLTEIKEVKHQHRTNHRINKTLFCEEDHFCIHICQRNQDNQ
jgi:hypothetical protein